MYSQDWEKAEYDSSLKEVEQRRRWEQSSLLSASKSCETQGGEVRGHMVLALELVMPWFFGTQWAYLHTSLQVWGTKGNLKRIKYINIEQTRLSGCGSEWWYS